MLDQRQKAGRRTSLSSSDSLESLSHPTVALAPTHACPVGDCTHRVRRAMGAHRTNRWSRMDGEASIADSICAFLSAPGCSTVIMLHFRIKRGLLALLIFTASCVGAVTSESSPSAAVNSTLLSSSHPSHPPRPPSSDRGYGPEQSSNRAGLLTTRTHRRNLWYWFFESRSAPETDPLVLWLSGGPVSHSDDPRRGVQELA
jgi:hypothetical protein